MKASKPPSGRGRSKRPGVRAAKSRVSPGRPPSGRVHLYLALSLDGYIAAPDGGVDWLTPYADARADFGPFIQTIGSAVLGRVTYDHAAKYGYRNFGEMPSYVVTHRPFRPPVPAIIPFTGDLAELVGQLRARHPGDIWLMGGGRLAKAFQEVDLIDIWTVAFVPTLLGAGVPLFPPSAFAEHRIGLVSTDRFPSGVIRLRYERTDPSRRDRSPRTSGKPL
jgi:dihydrofolate reductase